MKRKTRTPNYFRVRIFHLWWSVVCQIRTQSLNILVGEVCVRISVVVVNYNDLVVVEDNLPYEVIHEVFSRSFVCLVEMEELLEPKLDMFPRESL